MSTEENVKHDEQPTVEETPEEKNDGGLKIKTNVKAGQGGDDIIIKGG
jgi:hypothetical protein